MSNEKFRLLVVDDDNLVLQSLKIAAPDGWHVTGVNHLDDIKSDIKKCNFHAAMVDMHLTGNLSKPEGPDLIQKLHSMDSQLEIIAMSGDLNRETMELCLKAGATRFLAKPLSQEELNLTLEKIEALQLLKRVHFGREEIKPWIGSSQPSKELQKKLADLKGEDGPILIEGPSGAGKEIVARLLHAQEEPGRPLIVVNVAALPDNLFESEVFGHVKGAFTGADQNKAGLAEAAHGGDLFLDEIEALPEDQQAKFLRFLESGEIRRVGSRETIQVNTRVIAATNRNLEEMVQKGEFREDLMWRLNGKKLLVPALKDRIEDLPELVKVFIDQEKPKRNKEIDTEAIDCLKAHAWPGNVRELKRTIEQLCWSSPLPIIRVEDVQSVLRVQSSSNQTANEAKNLDLSQGLPKLVENFESMAISQALKDCGDIDTVARTLKISRSSLYKKIKDYQIDNS